MKVKYVCDVCGTEYENRELATECEACHAKEMAAELEREKNKEARSKEIEDLINKYVVDFKELPTLHIDLSEVDMLKFIKDAIGLCMSDFKF